MVQQVISLILFVNLVLGFAAFSYADENPELVKSNITGLYIPQGFDSNDTVEVMVEGYLPNTCYKLGKTEVSVDKENKKIEITQMAYRYDGICLEVIVPYEHMVTVGILPSGEYLVSTFGRKNKSGQLPITVAKTKSPDEVVYAPVSEMQLMGSREQNKVLKLSGVFTNSCMKIDEVRVLIESDSVVTVLPVVKLASQTICAQGMFPFTTEKELPTLKNGRYLIHVRSLNGKAVGKLVDL